MVVTGFVEGGGRGFDILAGTFGQCLLGLEGFFGKVHLSGDDCTW